MCVFVWSRAIKKYQLAKIVNTELPESFFVHGRKFVNINDFLQVPCVIEWLGIHVIFYKFSG